MSTFFRALTIAVLIMLPVQVFAQSHFLEKGRNGLGVTYGISRTETGASTVSSSEVKGTFTISGRLDLGIRAARTSSEDAFFGGLVETGYQPSLRINLLQHSRRVPVSLAIGAAYYWGKVTGNALDVLGWDVSGRGPTYSAVLFRQIPVTSTFFVVPQGSARRFSMKTTTTDASGIPSSGTDKSTSFDVNLSLCAKLSPEVIFAVTPGVAFGEHTTWGASASLVLSD